MQWSARAILAVLVSVVMVSSARAQSRPLVTEDPETVPVGFILAEGGFDILRGAVFPASGLKGDLFRIGTFGLSIGVSSIAELQIDGGLRRRLSISSQDLTAPLAGAFVSTGSTTSGFDDLIVGAKVRFVSETETRPAFALRIATRLPAGSEENGLKTGTFDFQAGLAAAKTVRSVRVAANFGLLVLGDPVGAGERSRLLTYGVSMARAVAPGAELVGELNGRIHTDDGPPAAGAESRGALRLGGRLTRGPVRLDGGFLIGISDTDPSWGLTAGFTWVFKAFEVK